MHLTFLHGAACCTPPPADLSYPFLACCRAYYINPATYVLYGTTVTQLGDLTDEFIDLGPGGGAVRTLPGKVHSAPQPVPSEACVYQLQMKWHQDPRTPNVVPWLAGVPPVSVAAYISDTYSYDYDFRGWLVLILIGG
jgi:hypothetical protein